MATETKVHRAYRNHKSSAKQRSIPFQLSFYQWWSIWRVSGRLDNRGRFRGNYCMARFGDKGAYEVGNVKIVTVTQNGTEKKLSAESRARISAANKGYALSPGLRAKISAGNKKWHREHPNSFSEERRAMLRKTLAKTKQRYRQPV